MSLFSIFIVFCVGAKIGFVILSAEFLIPWCIWKKLESGTWKKDRVGYYQDQPVTKCLGCGYRAEGCSVTEITWVGEEQLPAKNSQLRVDKTRLPGVSDHCSKLSWPCSAGAECSVDETVGCRWVSTSWWHRGPLLDPCCCRIGRASGQGRGCRRGGVAYFTLPNPSFLQTPQPPFAA